MLDAVLVSYRYRVYPSPGQRQTLAKVFGCSRVVYNDCLRLREECYATGEKISDSEIQRRVITLAKATPEREWLAEAPSVVLVPACNDARRAYLAAGRAERLNACGGDVRPGHALAAASEAGTNQSEPLAALEESPSFTAGRTSTTTASSARRHPRVPRRPSRLDLPVRGVAEVTAGSRGAARSR